MTTQVHKISGLVEEFNLGKLRVSLLRAGATKNEAEEIVARVVRNVGPETSTKDISRLARKYLYRKHRPAGLRYALKRALFRLGPTGYPFERYTAELLRHDGYRVDVGVVLDGKCVTHEVDVIAVSDSRLSVIECKYHNTQAATTDVKVAMYVHSRFRDLEQNLTTAHPGKRFSPWLVTNTRGTADAVKYAECAGIKMVSWRYPPESGLERMIEANRLYPVTIIPGIHSGLATQMIARGIILAKDLLDMDSGALCATFSLDERRARNILRRAEELCRY